MDIAWLEDNSFKSRDEVRGLFSSLLDCHFNSGQEWHGAVTDMFSDIAPSSRAYFWEELEEYSKANVNFKSECVRNDIEEKLREYPPLPTKPNQANELALTELRRLFRRIIYNPEVDPNEEDALSICDYYFETRWVLGQILATFPDMLDDADWETQELPEKYLDLEEAYGVVEFVVKTLSDAHNRDFFTDEHSSAFVALMQSILSEED